MQYGYVSLLVDDHVGKYSLNKSSAHARLGPELRTPQSGRWKSHSIIITRRWWTIALEHPDFPQLYISIDQGFST